ncbi:hypothetical protein BJ170DRAFT_598457 [Xylariales sp. AK1849]|nr:hypothetical protein BJ170DRAFT_598457 [Xylariales sp. AK1849]
MRALHVVTYPLKAIYKVVVPKAIRNKLRPTLDIPAIDTPPSSSSTSTDNKSTYPIASPPTSTPHAPKSILGKATEKPPVLTSTPPPPPLEECPICHDPVGIPNPENTTESWTTLYCGHRFGTNCIQVWLQESLDRNDPRDPNPSCPVCRVEARHPGCGHAVSPTRELDVQWHVYQNQMQNAAYQPIHLVAGDRARGRRRLQRREGHPLRPSSQIWPPKQVADTVGQCGTCDEKQKYEERMKRIMDRVQANNDAKYRPKLSDRRAGFKSYIPPQIRIRSTGSSGEPSSPVDGEEIRGRIQSDIYNVDEISRLQRRPTPAPSGFHTRRMSY